jgi:hypothetical protein
MFAAVHEAGHAVIARAFGVFGGRAGLKDTENGVAGFAATAAEDTLPTIWARRGKFRTPEAAIRAMIIIEASGAEAEELFYNLQHGDSGDRENIARLLALLPERSRREDRLRAFARQLVRRHKILIAVVAALLVERLEVSGRR